MPGDWLAQFRADAPEFLGDFAVKVPASLGDFEAERTVRPVRVLGEAVAGEDESGPCAAALEVDHQGGEHPPAHPAPFVLRGNVDGPEVAAGRVSQIHRNAPNGCAVLDGHEVPVGAFFPEPGDSRRAPGRVSQVPQIEGVVGEATNAPFRHLCGEVLVPGAEFESFALNRRWVFGLYHTTSIGR